jgi:ferric-dicitrate binding protein FerR (iron transport regulator)
MTARDRERPDLAPDDAAFVRRLAELSAAPEASPARRAAFQAELDRRLARRRGVGWSLLAGAVAAGAALAVLLRAGDGPPAPADGTVTARAEAAAVRGQTATPEEALLSLTSESAADPDVSLPNDYVAIATLLLGEV